MVILKLSLLLFTLFFLLPLGVSAARHRLEGGGAGWRTADRSSAGLLPPATLHPEAVVRVFAARTVRWRGIFAVHCWLVFKPDGAGGYTRYDYTAWGEPIRMNGFEPDGRWFGRAPEVVFAAVMAAVPEAQVSLPPTAIGKDYPHDGRWLRLTPSGTGIRLTLGGYAGFTLGWVEGIEINILGAVAGLDLRYPAIKLPGLGRLGMARPHGLPKPVSPSLAPAPREDQASEAPLGG
jgi:hypothetical protein